MSITIARPLQKFEAGQAPASKSGGLILVAGLEGVGKSTLLIKSEDVATLLYYNNFDRDASHLLKLRKAEYYYQEYNASTYAQANEALATFDGMVDEACKTGYGVFGIDNGDSFWRTVKLAKLPEGDPDPAPKLYDEANAYVDSRLLRLVKSGLWVVVTAPAKEVWTRERAGSGEYEPKGWNNMKFHLIGYAFLFLNTKPRGTAPVPLAQTFQYTYNAYIHTAKKRPLVEGSIITDPTLRKLLEKMKLIEKTGEEK